MNQNDNVTAHAAQEYDVAISTTIPFYSLFHQAIIELLASLDVPVDTWLDTGCGTGKLAADACKVFPQTKFTLADPSTKMLALAQKKLASNAQVAFVESDSQSLRHADDVFDVITAVQSHHYLDGDERRRAACNCFRMLKPSGIFVTFENIMPLSETGLRIGLKRWKKYQRDCGKTAEGAARHLARFGKEYFPVTILDHLEILRTAGFSCAEILWASYMQAGFYAIK